MAAEPLKAAIVGYGMAGAKIHAPLITGTPGIEVAAIVTGNPERRARVAAEQPQAVLLARTSELWARADEFDVVVVAAANRAHVSTARDAIAHGLPVVVDKPLAGTANDAAGLVKCAREQRVLLSVFHNRRLDSDFLTLRRLLASRELGDVRRFESRFERWSADSGAGWRDSSASEDLGGQLYDLGTHLIDQALQLFGPADGVYAELDQRRPSAGVDDDDFVAIKHRGGVRSHLWMSRVTVPQAPRFRVVGEHGVYVKYGMDGQETRLRAGEVPGAGWGAEPVDSDGELVGPEQTTSVRAEDGAWPDFYGQLVAALRGDSPPPVDPADAVAVAAVIDAARRSAEQHAVIPVS